MSEEQFLKALESLEIGGGAASFYPWLSPLAIFLSAVFAFFASWRAINTQRRIARKRATLDVLFRLESDAAFLKAAEVFQDVRDGRGFMSLVKDKKGKSNRDKEEELYVDMYLNHLELLCVGMSEDTIDELFLFQYMRNTVVGDWRDVEDYVKDCRERSPKNHRLFQKLEKFATAWDRQRTGDIFDGSDCCFVTRKDDASHYLDGNSETRHTQD
ncbi:DUF4760 domain-containing protein [Halomonas sp. H5]|uniref:DUF4760 domain-containing protein n=1 Tax=Halomonas sp. H5 TaxID=3423910 RepID=UPI003D360147